MKNRINYRTEVNLKYTATYIVTSLSKSLIEHTFIYLYDFQGTSSFAIPT